MTRVLVTGGAGFIGSHLVDALLEDGYRVTVLDDLSTGSDQNLRKHLSISRVRMVIGDVRNADAVRRAMDGVDAVVHLAAVVDIGYSVANPVVVSDVNVGGTLSVLSESVRLKVRRLVFASSTAVYGDSGRLPLREDDELRPISPYAVTKVAGEHCCNMYSRTFGLEAVSLRFFNVYGPRQAVDGYAGVVRRFVDQAYKGLPPVIYGDGEQTRGLYLCRGCGESVYFGA